MSYDATLQALRFFSLDCAPERASLEGIPPEIRLKIFRMTGMAGEDIKIGHKTTWWYGKTIINTIGLRDGQSERGLYDDPREPSSWRAARPEDAEKDLSSWQQNLATFPSLATTSRMINREVVDFFFKNVEFTSIGTKKEQRLSGSAPSPALGPELSARFITNAFPAAPRMMFNLQTVAYPWSSFSIKGERMTGCLIVAGTLTLEADSNGGVPDVRAMFQAFFNETPRLPLTSQSRSTRQESEKQENVKEAGTLEKTPEDAQEEEVVETGFVAELDVLASSLEACVLLATTKTMCGFLEETLTTANAMHRYMMGRAASAHDMSEITMRAGFQTTENLVKILQRREINR